MAFGAKLALAALGVVALLAAGKKDSSGAAQQKAAQAEAPVDANNMLAIVLSPSVTDVGTLNTFKSQFLAAYANATARSDNRQAFRLKQYATATDMKITALQAGKVPDATALLNVATVAAPALDTSASNLTAAQQLAMSQAPTDANTMLSLVLSPSLVDTTAIDNYINQFKAGAANAVGRGDQVQAYRLTQYAVAANAKNVPLKASQAPPAPEQLLTLALVPFGSVTATTTSTQAAA